MARDLNRVTLIGRLGKDPEVRSLTNGDKCATFSIATSETWKDKDSGEKREKTEWINLVAWRGLADICAQYLKKGSRIYAEGKFTTRSWDDSEGKKRYATEVVLENMQMLDAPSGNGQGNAQREAPPAGRGAGNRLDDEIPF